MRLPRGNPRVKHHHIHMTRPAFSIRPDGEAAGLARAEESMQGLLNALTGGGVAGEPVHHEQIVSRGSSSSSGVSPLELSLPVAAGPGALPAPHDLAAFVSDELAALVGDEEPVTDTSQARESSGRSDDETVTETTPEQETSGGPGAVGCADEGTDEAEAEAAAAVAAAERELAAGYTMSKQSGEPGAAEGSAPRLCESSH